MVIIGNNSNNNNNYNNNKYPFEVINNLIQKYFKIYLH